MLEYHKGFHRAFPGCPSAPPPQPSPSPQPLVPVSVSVSWSKFKTMHLLVLPVPLPVCLRFSTYFMFMSIRVSPHSLLTVNMPVLPVTQPLPPSTLALSLPLSFSSYPFRLPYSCLLAPVISTRPTHLRATETPTSSLSHATMSHSWPTLTNTPSASGSRQHPKYRACREALRIRSQ